MSIDLSVVSSLGTLLYDACQRHGDNIALVEMERDNLSVEYTYHELLNSASLFAAALQSEGFNHGERLAIIMQNQSKWLIAAFGTFLAGGVLVPIDYKLTTTEQTHLLRHSSVKYLLTENHIWNNIQPELNGESPVKCAIVTDFLATNGHPCVKKWSECISNTHAFHCIHRNRDDIACIVYSSGTSGSPKGCMLTHGNYLAQAEILANLFPITTTSRYFSVLPTNHAIDFMCGFILPLNFGARIIHQRTLRPQYIASTMKAQAITHIALAPMILQALAQRIEERLSKNTKLKKQLFKTLLALNKKLTRNKPRPSVSRILLRPLHQQFGGQLQLIFAGGSFVDEKISRFFYDIGIPVIIGYGLTEAGTVLTVNRLETLRHDTVGQAVPGLEVEFRDIDENNIGEIWVKGPTVMTGYLHEKELTKKTIHNKWLKTGDRGRIEIDGHIKLLGRSKNMIVTSGSKNVYPEDIEAYFNTLKNCEEYAIFAANYIWPTHTLTNERIIIVSRPTEGTNKTTLEAEYRERNSTLVDFKRISGHVMWHKEFPRTASLKLKRNLLAEQIRISLKREIAIQDLYQ